MNHPSFQFSNLRTTRMRCAIEPEGMVYEIAPGATVEITITSGQKDAIELQFREDEDGPILSIWPSHGGYEVEGLQDLSD